MKSTVLRPSRVILLSRADSVRDTAFNSGTVLGIMEEVVFLLYSNCFISAQDDAPYTVYC